MNAEVEKPVVNNTVVKKVVKKVKVPSVQVKSQHPYIDRAKSVFNDFLMIGGAFLTGFLIFCVVIGTHNFFKSEMWLKYDNAELCIGGLVLFIVGLLFNKDL